MRVMLTSGGDVGGIEHFVRTLAVGLLERHGLEPIVCQLYPRPGHLAEDLGEYGIRVIHCPKGTLTIPQYLRKFVSVVKGCSPQVLHINSPRCLWLQILAGKGAGVPSTVLTVHACADRFRSKAKMCVTTLSPLRFLDAYIAVSMASARLLSSRPWSGELGLR